MKLLSRLTFLAAGVIAILLVSGLSVTAQSTIWQIVNGVVRGPVPFAVGPLSVSSTAVTSTVPYRAPDGTAGAPAFTFASNATDGWFTPSPNQVAGATAGAQVFRFSSIGIALAPTAALNFEGTLNAAPDVSLSRLAADVVAVGAGDAYGLASKAFINTAPTVTSAGTSPSVTASNGTAAFRVNVGTGGTATTIVMAMPAATTGWNCHAENITAAAANRANQTVKQQSSTTTAVTVQNQTVSTGAALAFTASDIVSFICTAY